jgi:hypothetical protein
MGFFVWKKLKEVLDLTCLEIIKGYPLQSWLMTLDKDGKQSILEMYNKKHKQNNIVVDNVFSVLKKRFSELHGKTKMHIAIIPDLIICSLLHNLLIDRNEINVEHVLNMLQEETTAKTLLLDNICIKDIKHLSET